MSVTDATELLALARQLCDHPSPELEGRWPRAVAIITRTALDATLDEYWQQRAPGVSDSLAARPKMLCLPTYLDDDTLAHDAYQTWASLSAACHRHAYELEPTADELLGWIDRVEAVRDGVLLGREAPPC